MAQQHRLDKLKAKLRDRIVARRDELAAAMDGPLPPGTVKLTEDEQLEQYFAMDAQKWQAMIQAHGMADAMEYSEAMQKLVEKKFGPSMPAMVDGMLPGEGPQPPGALEAPEQQALVPDVQVNPANVDAKVNEALAAVGLTPEMVANSG